MNAPDAAFRAANGGLRLNLGCGSKPRAGFLGVDLGEHTTAQVRMDVLAYLRSLPDGAVAEVYSRHMLEHLEPAALRALLQEVDRVLMPGGKVLFIVPHASNPWFWSDPTHRQPFAVHTFSYLCETSWLPRKVPSYVAIRGWHLERVRLGFRPYARPRVLGIRVPMLSGLLEPLVNVGPRAIEIFERYFAGVLSIYEISFWIHKRG